MKIIIACLSLCIATCAVEPDTKTPKLSYSIRADIKRMWETVSVHDESGRKASSGRATEAAHRVFVTAPLVGMTRQEVIQLLGDPQTSSDSIYNTPFYPIDKDKLAYRFDTGFGGWQFDFTFDEKGHVSKVTPLGIE